MRGTSHAIKLVAQALDLFLQMIALVSIPIPIPIRARLLASESLDLALLSLELSDHLVAGRGAPARVHASVMPRRETEYKYDFLDFGSRWRQSPAATR